MRTDLDEAMSSINLAEADVITALEDEPELKDEINLRIAMSALRAAYSALIEVCNG